ncbi:DVU_1551 family NTP transferase [Nitratidesulfovibrio liaohensis]|uniref:NTP transferase domain-containing protein n=1 Tax=Nitratidesulfovibrio liaohensis TaxID=2604158 RepID=A0ABY9R420_9BACT|nr:NTP transferase domain-containing protein [Nitratidesulfovibrio liaohensis]WMW66199.1 NTP transferase domain-containing protein [Nitratidesulfovibrio liaohensis]
MQTVAPGVTAPALSPYPVVGVVLAAGASSRMAPDFKPLLDLCGVSVLARCVALFRQAGVADVLVVTGHRADEVAAEAARLGAPTVHNPVWREGGMFSSVRAGLEAVARRGGQTAEFGRADGAGGTGVLLLPVDAALVRPLTVRLLLERAAMHPDRVLLPVFDGQWGHPPLLPPSVFPIVLADSGEGGLCGALHRLGPQALEEVGVPDRFILRDMDTPEDYRAASADWSTREVPTPQEARALLAVRAVTPGGIAHAEGVAAVAVRLADALNAARTVAGQDEGAGGQPGPRAWLDRDLDSELTEAAALLHDIAKGQPRHEAAGGALLCDLGFSGVADIVSAHRDATLADGQPLTEREVVYFADKLVRCHTVVDVERRFGEKLAQWRHDPEAASAIEGRMRRALALRARIEREAGRPLADILHPLAVGQSAWEPDAGGAGLCTEAGLRTGSGQAALCVANASDSPYVSLAPGSAPSSAHDPVREPGEDESLP